MTAGNPAAVLNTKPNLKGADSGTVKVGERGQIIIPKEARQVFDIKAGDILIVLGDEKWGIAVTKSDVLEKHAFDVFQKIAEETPDEDK